MQACSGILESSHGQQREVDMDNEGFLTRPSQMRTFLVEFPHHEKVKMLIKLERSSVTELLYTPNSNKLQLIIINKLK